MKGLKREQSLDDKDSGNGGRIQKEYQSSERVKRPERDEQPDGKQFPDGRGSQDGNEFLKEIHTPKGAPK